MKNAWIVVGLVAGFVACLGDFVLAGWLGWLSPGYNFLRDSMSVLGASGSPFRWIFAGWGIVFAVLWWLYAYGLVLMVPGQKEIRNVSWLLILYGFGEGIGSGIFPFDHSRQGSLTLSGTIHSLLSVIGVFALLLIPFFLSRFFKSGNKTARHLSILMLVVGVGLLVLFAVSRLPAADHTIFVFRGLWQRLFLLTYYLYLTGVSILLYRN